MQFIIRLLKEKFNKKTIKITKVEGKPKELHSKTSWVAGSEKNYISQVGSYS